MCMQAPPQPPSPLHCKGCRRTGEKGGGLRAGVSLVLDSTRKYEGQAAPDPGCWCRCWECGSRSHISDTSIWRIFSLPFEENRGVHARTPPSLPLLPVLPVKLHNKCGRINNPCLHHYYGINHYYGMTDGPTCILYISPLNKFWFWFLCSMCFIFSHHSFFPKSHRTRNSICR